MRRLILAVALVLLAGCQSTSPGSSRGPALWAARDHGTTVYLFGTKHVVSASTRWLTPRISAAFADSGELWVEADLRDEAAAARALVGRGIDQEYDLGTALSEASWTRVRDALAACGIPGGKIVHTRPWFAVFILSACASTHPAQPGGPTPITSAPDMLLVGLAASSGKPVHGFETPAQQVAALAQLSDRTALAILEAQPSPSPTPSPSTNGAVVSLLAIEEQAWANGDVGTLDALVLQPARRSMGNYVDAILTRRNQGFADGIAALLQQRRSAFVAVGAAHLLGRDGVLGLLHDRGIAVTRDN